MKGIPNYQELVARPRETLAQQEIRINAWSFLLIALCFAAVALAGLVLINLFPFWDRIWWTILITGSVGFPISVVAAFWYGRPGIVLQERGVTIVRGRYEAFCPWSIFASAGTPFTWQNAQEKLFVPLSPGAAGLIEVHKDGHNLGHESLARLKPALAITKSNQLTISGLYKVKLAELGELMLYLGSVLGSPQPAPMDMSSIPDEAALLNVSEDERGWIKVNVTQLAFPPVCCYCGLSATIFVIGHFSPSGLRAWIRSVLTHSHQHLSLSIPICRACQAIQRRKSWTGSLVGGVAGILLSLGVAIASERDILSWLWFVPVGGFGSCMLGWAVVQRPPLKLRHLSNRDGTVSIRFRRAEYAAVFLEHLNRHER